MPPALARHRHGPLLLFLGACLVLALVLLRWGAVGTSSALEPELERAVDDVFDTRVLHEVAITVEPRWLDRLDHDTTSRVPCTLDLDGTKLQLVGIRRKGGINSRSSLTEKPAFSVKLNAFIQGQRLHGIDKLILNNGKQDAAFLNEHLGYEICRRAGLPAPHTAHAVVTFNGRPYGIYVLAEAVDHGFLERNFGAGDASGNLYEGSCPMDDPCTDFLELTDRMELKQETRQHRSRDDLRELVDAIHDAPDETWVGLVRARLDLDGFITEYAVDALTNHWDSYFHNENNYYLYHRPSDGRFVMIPHGMDSLFGVDGVYAAVDSIDPLEPPDADLAARVRETPETDRQYRRELERVLDHVWDVRALNQRIDDVSRVLHSTTRRDPRTVADLARFDATVGDVRRFIVARKQVLRGRS